MSKSLICITSCNRLPFLKLIAPDYLNFCFQNPDFHFLVAHDGPGEDYQLFCKELGISLINSVERYGVGISKNRVLETFPDYDYYFFIDDDVELLNGEIFQAHINAHLKTGLHHFSSGPEILFRDSVIKKETNGIVLLHSLLGSGAFNFFTKQGLSKVGGWHTEFAKYKRFGHTEHTYRFVNNNLAEYPFNVLHNFIEGYIKLHTLSHVTLYNSSSVGKTGLALVEEEILNQKLKWFEVNSLGGFTHNKINCAVREISDQLKDVLELAFSERLFSDNYLSSNEFKYAMSELYKIAITQNADNANEILQLKSRIKTILASPTFRVLNKINKTIKFKK
jgi:hypothetical protein